MCGLQTSQWTTFCKRAFLKPFICWEGEGGYQFWMLWSSLFSLRGVWTHHAPFTAPSTQNDISKRTTAAVHAAFYYSWFRTRKKFQTYSDLVHTSSFIWRKCVLACVCTREKQKSAARFALTMLCKISWCIIMSVQLEFFFSFINLFFRLFLHLSKSK